MAKGASSKDKKPAEKKGGDKGKGKSEAASEKGGKVRNIPVLDCFLYFVVPIGRGFQGKGGLKAATAVNVRHILCEKHSKAMEALQRIQARYAFMSLAAEAFLSYYSCTLPLATRAESDSTKLLRNVRRTKPKV
jgi:peptidyl-prolyl cis-trans isomerase NIMA-interacting 4